MRDLKNTLPTFIFLAWPKEERSFALLHSVSIDILSYTYFIP